MSNYIDYDNAVELFTEVGNKRKASESMQESLLKSTVGWTGKNLLKNEATSRTLNGVTFTVNTDGSVTVNGTATANTFLVIYPNTATNKYENNIISGCPTGGDANNSYSLTVRVGLQSDDTYVRSVDDIGNGQVVPKVNTSTEWIRIYIRIASGYTANNLIFYPMLRDASITDDTYEPYHESVEEVVEQIYADNGVLGAKNLLLNTSSSGTYNGITFTNNSDGSVTVNGTATALAWRSIGSLKLPVGKYILNGCPSGGDTGPATYCIALWNTDGGTAGSIINVRDAGEGVIVDITRELTYLVSVGIANGQTVNNLTFYPMLRLASDPDDTYVPYAMTNREITEELAVQESAVTDIIEGATVNDNYLYKYGKVVQLVLAITGITATANSSIIVKIPEGFRPKRVTDLTLTSNKHIYVSPSGNVIARQNMNNDDFRGTGTWITD